MKTLEERLERIREALPGQLLGLLEPYVKIENIGLGPKQRHRVFPPAVTLWAMLAQVLRGGSLRDAVSEVRTRLRSARRGHAGGFDGQLLGCAPAPRGGRD